MKRWIQSYHYNTNRHGEALSNNGLRQMGSMIFQWGFNSGACLKIPELGILLKDSSVRVCLFFLYQGCCSSGQYNLPDRMFRLDVNTTLNQNYVLFITLINITYQSRDQYLPSIHSCDSSPWQVLYIPLFCFVCVFRVVLVFFKCLVNLTSFLFKSRFISLLFFVSWTEIVG